MKKVKATAVVLRFAVLLHNVENEIEEENRLSTIYTEYVVQSEHLKQMIR